MSGEYGTALVQAGALSCTWAGPAVDVDLGIDMTLDVLAEASAEFALHERFETASVLDSVSPGSAIACGESSFQFTCSVSFLINGYWIELEASSVPTGRSSSAGQDLGATIAERLIDAGGPRAAYVPPAEALGVGSSCAAIDNGGAFGAALGSPQLSAPSDDVPDTGQFVIAVSEKAGRLVCNWTSDHWEEALQQVTVAITPGGSWNFASVVAENPNAIPVAVEGGSGATSQSSDGTICSLTADVDGSLLYVLVLDNRAPPHNSCATAATIVQLVRTAA
jgi:hypothetical protein